MRLIFLSLSFTLTAGHCELEEVHEKLGKLEGLVESQQHTIAVQQQQMMNLQQLIGLSNLNKFDSCYRVCSENLEKKTNWVAYSGGVSIFGSTFFTPIYCFFTPFFPKNLFLNFKIWCEKAKFLV